MTQTAPGRTGTLVEVSLKLSQPEIASLLPRSPHAPPLVTTLLRDPGRTVWATQKECDAAAMWLQLTASELNAPIERSLVGRPYDLAAAWRWPDRPLVQVTLDGNPVANVDYLPASASAHWYLHWTGDPTAAHGPPDLPLLPLSTRVPEEAEEDDAIRVAVLDAAIEAAATELTGRAVSIDLRDV